MFVRAWIIIMAKKLEHTKETVTINEYLHTGYKQTQKMSTTWQNCANCEILAKMGGRIFVSQAGTLT